MSPTSNRPDYRAWFEPLAASFGLVLVPSATYALLHVLGYVYPAQLWGVDMLAYYGPVAAVPVIAVVWLAVAPPTIPPAILRLMASRRFPWLLGLGAAPLLWAVRVRAHALGDSHKWFAVVGNAIERSFSFADVAWHNASLDLPGFEFINYQQAFDLAVHVGVYAVLHAFGGSEPRVAYELVSIVAGCCYLPVLWALAGRLANPATERIAVFLFLASLGTLQLFCGYGESYTLVTLLCAVYLVCAIDVLRGDRPLWHAGAVLLVGGATHMLALSLAPSFAVLVWCHPRWGWVRHPWLLVSLAAVAMVAACAAYLQFYHNLHLPLLSVDASRGYALLSLRHAFTLGNALLLTGPFGLIWGLAGIVSRRPSSPQHRLLGCAAGGPTLLIAVHYISMGGRDWDLMSFPSLMLAAWGVSALQGLVADRARVLLRFVVPIMAVHTAFWIGINADQARATARLEQLLLGDANQAPHAHAYTRGHFYHNITRDYRSAVPYLRQAIALHPGDAPRHYRQFLSRALVGQGEVLFSEGELDKAYRACLEATELDPEYSAAFRNLGLISFSKGDYDVAVGAFQRATQLAPDDAQALYGLGIAHLRRGDRAAATAAWADLRQLDADLAAQLQLRLSPPGQ